MFIHNRLTSSACNVATAGFYDSAAKFVGKKLRHVCVLST